MYLGTLKFGTTGLVYILETACLETLYPGGISAPSTILCVQTSEWINLQSTYRPQQALLYVYDPHEVNTLP